MQSPALCATQTQQFCLPKVLLSLASPGMPDPLFQVSPFILLPPLGSQHHINSSDLVFPSSRFFPSQFIVSYTPSASACVSWSWFSLAKTPNSQRVGVPVDTDVVSESPRTLSRLERGTETLEMGKMFGTHDLLFLFFFVQFCFHEQNSKHAILFS